MSHVLADLILGNSAPIALLRSAIAQVAPTGHRVLIHGPSGSGKELVALAIHLLSGRRGQFVPINVCAIPETMFEAMVFGHVKGAFTGATNDARGFLLEAHQGTAFFDEISGLPINNQSKVLRGIESRSFRPVGARADQTSDFRLISATNEHLGTLASSGRFRSDLLHRIGTIPLRVPSLVDRIEDVPILVHHFARQSSLDDTPAFEVTCAAMQALQTYHWPGNVRQLRNVIECATTVSTSPLIERPVVEETLRMQRWLTESRQDELKTSVGCDDPFEAGQVVADTMSRRRYIALLESCGWRVERTADAIGIHRATLSRHLRALGIDPKACRRSSQLVLATMDHREKVTN